MYGAFSSLVAVLGAYKQAPKQSSHPQEERDKDGTPSEIEAAMVSQGVQLWTVKPFLVESTYLKKSKFVVPVSPQQGDINRHLLLHVTLHRNSAKARCTRMRTW